MSSITGYNPATVSTLASGTYRHVALSISGTVHSLYLDGSMVAQTLSGGNVFASYTSAISNLYIGCAGDLSYGLTGSIDDFKVWNRALPATDISAIYYAQLVPPAPFTPNLVSGLRLWLDATVSGITTSTWPDKSGLGNNATGSGMTLSTINTKSTVQIALNNTINTNASFSTAPITLFFVMNSNASAFTYPAVNKTSSGLQVYITSTNKVGVGKYGLSQDITSTTTLSNTGLRIITVQLNGTGNTFNNAIINYDGLNNTSSAINMTVVNGNLSIFTEGSGFSISEYLYYNTLLTTYQYQQVEGYLAWKWGLQTSLPAYHPYYSAAPVAASTTFLPTIIPGLILWLDAADSTTFSGSTNSVTWSDKSGLGHNATSTTTNIGNYITRIGAYGATTYSTIAFTNNTASSIDINLKWTFKPTFVFPFTAIIVFDINNLASNADGFWFLSNYYLAAGSGGGIANSLQLYTGYATPRVEIGQAGGGIGVFSTTPSFNRLNMVTIQVFKIGSTYYGINNLNGTINTTYTTYSGTAAVLAQNWIMQMRGVNSALGVSEYLIYNNNQMSQVQYQQVEGYLAWKWGIQTSLPTTHPYYSAAPVAASTTFLPTIIPGMTLWLDAATNSNFTFSSGTTITNWIDKSGRGNNLTATVLGTRTYQTNTLNGLSTVSMQNSRFNSTAGVGHYPSDVYIVVKLNAISTMDVFGIGSSDGVFHGLQMGEYSNSAGGGNVGQARWDIGTDGFNRTGGTMSAANETSTSFLIMQYSVANNNFYIYRNGVQLSYTNSWTFSPPTNLAFVIGSRNVNTTQYLNGSIAEILCYNTQLSPYNRQQVEGYLAAKWGLQSLLPNTHPYYTTAPTATASV